MAHTSSTRASTRAKRATDPDPDPEDLEDHEELEDRARTDYGSDDESLFPDKDDDEDQGLDNYDYDEAADEAEIPFNRDDDPEYREREKALRMYMRELRFNRSVALTLYRDQGLDDASSILRLKDDIIDRMISAIRKEDPTLTVPISAVENLKLFVYYLKHRQRTLRPYDRIWNVTSNHLDRLSHHRDVEAMWDKKNKPPETVPMTIDQTSAAKCFTAMTVILGKFMGHDDVPLTYVIRPRILPPDYGYQDDPNWQPPFGQRGSPYSSIDEELKLRAPILHDPARNLFYLTDFEDMETDPMSYPRCDAFNTDNAQVYRILQSHWGKSPAWSQAKQFNRSQDGRAAYRTLHGFLLGRSQVVIQQAAYNKACETLRYTGEKRGFTFDSYVNKHVEQHHLMDELAEFGPRPPDDGLKIQWFQAGIECDLFTPVRAAIMTDHARFATFDAVKDAYIDFARQQIKNDNSSRDRRSVSAVQGRGGQKPQGRGGSRGTRGTDHQSEHRSGIPSQIEVDKCTHIQNKKYPYEEYIKFTPAEKQRAYQLRYPDAKPGTGPSRRGRRGGGGSNVSAITGSTESKTSKKRPRNGNDKDDEDESDVSDDVDEKRSNRANARQTK